MPNPQRSILITHQRNLIISKRRAGATEQEAASEMGLRCRHVRDVWKNTRRRTGELRRYLSANEQEWAIAQVRAGRRKPSTVARELGISKSAVNRLCLQFRSGLPLPAKRPPTLNSKDAHIGDRHIDEEKFSLLQALEPVEKWIKETKDWLVTLEQEHAGQFAWKHLHNMIKTLSTTIHFTRVAELQRTRRLLVELDIMNEHMQNVEAMMGQLSNDVEVKPRPRRLSLKLVNRDANGNLESTGHPKMSLSASETKPSLRRIRRADSGHDT